MAQGPSAPGGSKDISQLYLSAVNRPQTAQQKAAVASAQARVDDADKRLQAAQKEKPGFVENLPVVNWFTKPDQRIKADQNKARQAQVDAQNAYSQASQQGQLSPEAQQELYTAFQHAMQALEG